MEASRTRGFVGFSGGLGSKESLGVARDKYHYCRIANKVYYDRFYR